MASKMPYNKVVEDSFIGMVLTHTEHFEKVMSAVDPGFLFSPVNREIYQKAIAYFQEHEELDRYKFLGYVGVTLQEVITKCVTEHSYSATHFERLIKAVKEWHFRRELWGLGAYLLEQTPEKNEFGAILDRITTGLDGIEDAESTRIKHVRELVQECCTPEFFKSMTKSVVKTSWTNFNNDLIIKRGDLVIIAGRPSNGKTAFALALALEAAKKGQTVGFFSLEMRSEYLLKRMTQNVSYDAGLSGFAEFEHGCKKIQGLEIYLDDCANLNLSTIRNKIKYMVGLGAEIIMIDYLGLLDAPKAENRNMEITKISKALKNYAQKFNVPVIVLSQLSREVERRQNKKPQLSDLRDSGAIEQDADIILFCYRPHRNGDDTGTVGNPEKLFQLLCRKQRDGKIGDTDFYYDDTKHFFAPWDDWHVVNENKQGNPF